MSKGYASPEQIRVERLNLAADVYALGVILYELVTGQHPFSPVALSGPDWRRVIEEREPLAPSQAVLLENPGSNGAPSRPPETAAAARGSAPSRLWRVLAGNLDAIVMKSLKKSAAARYHNVARFRHDIERFLEGLPVTARPSGRWEIMRTWLARHRWAGAAAVFWALWMIVLLHVAMVEDNHSIAAVNAGRQEVRRLRFLLETGMQQVELGLIAVPRSREPRLLAARIHTGLLTRVEALPEFTLSSVDASLGISAIQCAALWQDLDDPQAALAVNTPALARMQKQYHRDRRDRQWRALYAGLLRQSIAIRSRLGQPTAAIPDTRRLVEVETGRE
jgi:hypothetical protein